jgi:non-heme chloroperoxidase
MPETIFMIHGMFCKGNSWDKFRAFFEEKGYGCITPTLRFHDIAPTDKPDPKLGTTSLLDYADDLQQEIEKLNQVPIIMGHSMGGLLAQILGSRGLAKVLVLLTPSSPRGASSLNPFLIARYIRIFGSALKRPGFWNKPFRLTFNESTYSALQLFPEEEQKKEYSKLVYESGKVLKELLFFGRATAVDESKLTVPVLVIGGKLDKMVPVQSARKIAKKYGDRCTYKEFADHSHMVISEPNWQDVAGYVAEWLVQVSK